MAINYLRLLKSLLSLKCGHAYFISLKITRSIEIPNLIISYYGDLEYGLAMKDCVKIQPTRISQLFSKWIPNIKHCLVGMVLVMKNAPT